MFQKLLKVTFYSIRKLQHLQPPTALPTWTGLDQTAGSLLAALAQGGPPQPGLCTAASAVSSGLTPRERVCYFSHA